MSITYREQKDSVTVRVGGVVVGHIRRLAYGLGWVYGPKGSAIRSGPFKTLAECKRSLETDAA